ncbi:MAG: hypothetical protein LBV18_04150 [Alistipes sp.]|jgi:hypothetical protein|nr:hypothetical protein [Alistipes sp.]
MEMGFLAIFIPIIFLIGLFAVIALNILFKYKAKELMANNSTSFDEWHKADTQMNLQVRLAKIEAREKRKQGTILRVSGLIAGIGLGVAIGCIVLASGGVSRSGGFDSDAIAVFLILSLAMLCGGAGLVGAYFLERKLAAKFK